MKNAIRKTIVLHEVEFAESSVEVIEQGGWLYVPMKPLCERMGLIWNAQYELIRRDQVLNSTIRMIRTVARDGSAICRIFDCGNRNLFSIQPFP